MLSNNFLAAIFSVERSVPRRNNEIGKAHEEEHVDGELMRRLKQLPHVRSRTHHFEDFG